MSINDRKAGSAQADPSCTLPRHAIILNCFGRGGSNIVWNMIGSSPDAIMPNSEWHEAVFGGHNLLRKTMRTIGRHADWSFAPGFARYVARKTMADVAPDRYVEKPNARALVLKVMGHHIVFAKTIEAGFETHRHLILTRHPLPMCEGLVRGGTPEDRAVAMFNAIARNMMDIAARDDTLVLKFEDMIADPAGFCRSLYERLNLAPPPDGMVGFKVKKFGADRRDTSAEGVYTRFSYSELPDRIDATVNRKAVERLDDATKTRIWTATQDKARIFGYLNSNY